MSVRTETYKSIIGVVSTRV